MPGDEIVGFVTRGRGVSIHRNDCVNVLSLDEISRYRITPVEWNLDESSIEQIFNAALDIITENRAGVIADISRLMLEEKINMDSINTFKRRTDVLLRVTFPIGGKIQLEKIIGKISGIRGIYEVTRTIT